MKIKMVSQMDLVVSSIAKKIASNVEPKKIERLHISDIADSYVGNANTQNRFTDVVSNMLNKVFKSKDAKTSDSLIIAKMARKGWYQDVSEKLNDIWVEAKSNNEYTGILDNNISAYNRLPQPIKEMLKPEDVDYYGHISQYKVDKLYEHAKAAKLIPQDAYPPSFHGHTDEMLQKAINSSEYVSDLDLLSKENVEVGNIIVDEIKNGVGKEQLISETLGDKTLGVTEAVVENMSKESVAGVEMDETSLLTTLKENLDDIGESISEFVGNMIGH